MTLRPDRMGARAFSHASFLFPQRLQGLQAYTVLMLANNVAWAIFIAVKAMNRVRTIGVKAQA